jgi:predicted dehydrogenase
VPAVESAEAFEQIGRGTIAPLVARFLDAIRTGAPASPSLADGLRAQLVLDAATQSAAHGAWVDVPPAS